MKKFPYKIISYWELYNKNFLRIGLYSKNLAGCIKEFWNSNSKAQKKLESNLLTNKCSENSPKLMTTTFLPSFDNNFVMASQYVVLPLPGGPRITCPNLTILNNSEINQWFR